METYQWRTSNFDLYSAPMAIEQWEFFSKPHLVWHRAPFIMVISENPWHSHLLPRVWQGSCHYLFYDLSLLRLEFEHRTFRMQGERSNRLRHRGGYSDYKEYINILSVYIWNITHFYSIYSLIWCVTTAISIHCQYPLTFSAACLLQSPFVHWQTCT